MTKKSDSLKYILKGTSKAINDVAGRYYADCYNTDKDMHRLMLWESKINRYLEENKDCK